MCSWFGDGVAACGFGEHSSVKIRHGVSCEACNGVQWLVRLACADYPAAGFVESEFIGCRACGIRPSDFFNALCVGGHSQRAVRFQPLPQEETHASIASLSVLPETSQSSPLDRYQRNAPSDLDRCSSIRQRSPGSLQLSISATRIGCVLIVFVVCS